MNNKLFWLIVPLALISASFTYRTSKAVNLPCSTANNTFGNGEVLTYKVYYNLGLIWIPAGEVEFSVKENTDTYEMKAIGKTYSSYESIFKVNDYFYTKVDKETLLPTNFVRIVEEGNYRLYDSISFQQDKNMAFSYHGKTKNSTTAHLHKWDGCMQDLVSNLYKLRTTDYSNFKKGDNMNIQILFDKEVFPIGVAMGGKEKKHIKGLGKFNTIALKPEVVVGNVFKKGNKMSVWISDDGNKIPLMVESPIAVGSLKMVLKSYKGLRYPLSSKE